MKLLWLMKRASITEAKNNLSALIDGLKSGSPVLIVDRGRPVALLSPIPEALPFEQLRAAGEVDSATVDLSDLPEPLVLPPGIESPSAALARGHGQRPTSGSIRRRLISSISTSDRSPSRGATTSTVDRMRRS